MFAEWRWGVARANRWATYGRKYDQHLVRVLIVGGLAGDSGKGPCSVANEPRPLHVWVDAILCNSVMFESYGFFLLWHIMNRNMSGLICDNFMPALFL